MRFASSKSARLIALFTLFISSSTLATVWWPEVEGVSSALSVYEDYNDNKKFYYIPKGAKIAHTDRGDAMLTHGLFFNRLKPSHSTTQYNITMEPILRDGVVRQAERELKRKHGPSATLSPLPITTVTFTALQSQVGGEGQIYSPFQVVVPEWTGDLHSFYQRFSVIMVGNMFASEPTMMKFVTGKGANAFAGTLHFGFRGIHRTFEGSIEMNVYQFSKKIKTHLSGGTWWAKFEVENAIDKLQDDRDIFVDVYHEEGKKSEIWDVTKQKIIDVMFEPVKEADAPGGPSQKGLFLTFSHKESSVERDLTIKLNLRKAVVKDHGGDIDITAGGVRFNQLDPNAKYMCEAWQIFNRGTDRCEESNCQPFIEYWDSETQSCKRSFGGI